VAVRRARIFKQSRWKIPNQKTGVFAQSLPPLYSDYPAAIVLFVTVFGLTTVYEYLAGFAWAGSLFALAFRGSRNEEGNAFAPVENKNANLAPVLLGFFSIAAPLESEGIPGAFLRVLAVAWTFAAPSWRPLWKSKPVRFIGAVFEIIRVIVAIAVIAMLVCSWLGKKLVGPDASITLNFVSISCEPKLLPKSPVIGYCK
jgi:hypothetical protein